MPSIRRDAFSGADEQWSFALLGDGSGEPVLLTKYALYRPDAPQPTILNVNLRVRGRQFSSTTSGGWIWVGTNSGELGGGLVRISAETGAVSTAVGPCEPGTSPCERLLDPTREPVTSLLALPGDPCLLVGTGLEHMFTVRGRVLRVCGLDDVKVDFSLSASSVTLIDDSLRGVRERAPRTLPIRGLALAADGYWALTSSHLVRVKEGKAAQIERLRNPEDLCGFQVSTPAPGVRLVWSDVRREVVKGRHTGFAEGEMTLVQGE